MAAPVVTPTPDKVTPYAPGAPITASWTVLDPDNSTERLVLEGVDSQGNQVVTFLDIQRQDTFQMTRVYWERTGTDLGVDNVNRRASGTVPSA